MKRNLWKSRFTLLEMLIVITIIFILVSILLGTHSRAKSSAKKVLCASNLGQLSMGYTFYAKNSEGEYPPFAWIMNTSEKNTNDDKLFAGHPPQGKGNVSSFLRGGAWIDSSMAKIMSCPSDKTPEMRVYMNAINPQVGVDDFKNVTSYNQTRTMGDGLVEVESSYGYNMNLGLYEVIQMSVPNPTTMLVNYDASSLFGETLKQNGASKPDLTDMTNIFDNTIEERHVDKANLLWADGHVSLGTLEDILDQNVFSTRWRTTGNGYFQVSN